MVGFIWKLLFGTSEYFNEIAEKSKSTLKMVFEPEYFTF